MKNKSPMAPRGLQTPGKAFWREITGEWMLDCAGLKLLLLACRCLDDMESARAVIEQEGQFQVNKAGRKVEHPAVALERKAKSQFAAIVEQMDLVEEQDRPRIGRPGIDAARFRHMREEKSQWQ